jgi:hypothetical protein
MRMPALLHRLMVLLMVAVWASHGARPARAEPAVAASAASAEPGVKGPRRSVPEPTPATPAEIERYAERERLAQPLERFQGGRASSTTIIVVLLLVIILVLLL